MPIVATFNLKEILKQARIVKPTLAVQLPFMNEADFFDSDNQTIQLDHHDRAEATELVCDTTVKLVEVRKIKMADGVIATLTTEYSRQAYITMNLKYKAIKIENFARDNANADADWNTTNIQFDAPCKLVDCENDPIDLHCENATCKAQLAGFEVVNFNRDVEPSDLDMQNHINPLLNEWLNSGENYQLAQALMGKALEAQA